MYEQIENDNKTIKTSLDNVRQLKHLNDALWDCCISPLYFVRLRRFRGLSLLQDLMKEKILVYDI